MNDRKGFSLIELLAVIVVLIVLVSIFFPSLGKAKDLSTDVVCKSHQHNVALAIVMYAGTYGDQFPFNADMPAWQGEQFTNDLTWNLRVGRVPFDQIPENMRDEATPGHEELTRICQEGFQDHQWFDRKSGSFKCPIFYEEIRPAPQYWPSPVTSATVQDGNGGYLPAGKPTMAGIGCEFSMNGQLSPTFGMQVSGDGNSLEYTEKVKTIKTTEVGGVTVMAGDAHVRARGGYLLPQAVYPTSAEHGLDVPAAKTDADRIGFAGPWMFQTDSDHGKGVSLDFRGHPGGGANLMFADGHVQGFTKLDPAQWKIKPPEGSAGGFSGN